MSDETRAAPKEPSLVGLILGVITDIRTLFSTEIQLATAEVRFNIGRLAVAFAIILAGGIIFGVAGIALLGALVAALSPSFGPVIGSLITAAVAAITGGGLLAIGITKMRTGPLAPRRALANLRTYADSVGKKQELRDDHP
ncbi:phage holin family protein [Polymorphobacter sp.]|uniref:phage holin family protein n=1 Tax=Polymorphobacter sp. TaxID=1909290 RepID=UPI003F71A6D7